MWTRDGLDQAVVVERGGGSRKLPKTGLVGFTDGLVVGSEKRSLKG